MCERLERMKRKQPGDMSARPPLPRVNILSDVVVSPVARPQGLGAVANGGGDNQQPVTLPQQSSSPPVLQITDHDFEAVNPDVMVLLDELEKTAYPKYPKLDPPTSVPQTNGGPEAGPPNLDDLENFEFCIPYVPPLLSPIKSIDGDDFNQPSSSSKSTPKKKNKNSNKKAAPILRGALENKKDFDCFSQSEERDAIKETAKIYHSAKEAINRERRAIEETEIEIKKLKEKIHQLEEKKKIHKENLDSASKKIKSIEDIFKH